MTEVKVGCAADLDCDEPYAGVTRRTFDAAGATVTTYEFVPGARFPRHVHPQEQVTLIDEGEVRMEFGTDAADLSAGAWSVIPGGVEHGITAGSSGARITAIIVPRRAARDAYEVVA